MWSVIFVDLDNMRYRATSFERKQELNFKFAGIGGVNAAGRIDSLQVHGFGSSKDKGGVDDTSFSSRWYIPNDRVHYNTKSKGLEWCKVSNRMHTLRTGAA